MSDSVQLKRSKINKLDDNKWLKDKNEMNKTNENIEVKSVEKEAKVEEKEKSPKKWKDMLKLEANRIIKLFIPISMCMIIVLLTIYFIPFYSSGIDPEIAKNIPLIEKETSTTGEKTISVLITVGIFALMMILVTTCMAFIFIYQYYRVISVFFVFAFVLYFAFFSYLYLRELCVEFNIAIDLITSSLIIWNFTIVGIITILIGGPKVMVQSYLVIMAALTSLLFIKFLPSWTAWVILFVMVLWDLYAVLHENGLQFINLLVLYYFRNYKNFDNLITRFSCNFQPKGPLKKLLDASQSTGKALPPIIYMACLWLSTEKNSTTEDGTDVELGLGDFIFYSLLVGKTFSSNHLLTAIICFISILVGLAITLFLLVVYDRALPALPISITFGIIVHIISVYCVNPFNDALISRQIDI